MEVGLYNYIASIFYTRYFKSISPLSLIANPTTLEFADFSFLQAFLFPAGILLCIMGIVHLSKEEAGVAQVEHERRMSQLSMVSEDESDRLNPI